MKRPMLLWIVALVITLVAAYYQRITGPTYPVSIHTGISGKRLDLQLERSHGGDRNATVRFNTGDATIQGLLEWKRFKTGDDWALVPMVSREGMLIGELPYQPPAGKLEYRVVLRAGSETVNVPPEGSVVMRFKGDVPPFILIPHVLAMFGAMLLSTRAGLEIFNTSPRLKPLTFWTLGLLFVGGLLFGPIVQKYAFGEYWTGIPFGTDLTDNKTLIAFLGWVVAAFALYKSSRPRIWVSLAAVLLFVVYLIPHSVLGSELDYAKTAGQTQDVRTVPH